VVNGIRPGRRNLLAHPAARIAVRGRVVPVTAKLATGAERDRLWDQLVAAWPAYAAYQRRTDREIRVFTLAPGA
jgi:deazaflavin-dependent oxidoreductase (nitroreductase family)